MSRKQVDSIWMCISIFCFLFLSISFLLMPLEGETPTDGISIYTLIAGLIFWISVIMGIVTQCILAYRRKMWYVIHHVKKVKPTQKIGLVSFFKNIYAAVADVATIIGLFSLIIVIFVMKETGYICYILVSVFVFSFSMHCVLNGKNFFHVVNQNKLLQAIKK